MVRYSLTRRLAGTTTDYWDFATLLELAVLDHNHAQAQDALAAALATDPEPWQPASTLTTLRRLHQLYDHRGEPTSWLVDIEQALQQAAGQDRPAAGRSATTVST